MSYGLNVEMHKQVSVYNRLPLPQVVSAQIDKLARQEM